MEEAEPRRLRFLSVALEEVAGGGFDGGAIVLQKQHGHQ